MEIPVPGSAVSASTNDGNVPANTVDGSLATRWSGSGDGAWIQYDLGAIHNVARVSVGAYQGNTRRNNFEIQVMTSSGWTTVFNGQSSGTTTAEENFDFGVHATNAVRYLGHGNTVNTWNSLTEVSIFSVP
jgi:hypothetical protein